MYYKKLMLVAVSALLGASFVQEASAWGTGGATTITRKNHIAGYNLFCDFNRLTFGGITITPGEEVQILTTPSAGTLAQQTAQATFKYSGKAFCAEIDPTKHASIPPSLEAAEDLDSPADGVGDVGLFELVQVPPKILFPDSGFPLPADRPGLQYAETTVLGVKTRTWTFVVPANPVFPFPELLYELRPVPGNANAQKFCEPAAPHRNPDPLKACTALLGLQIPANQADYPARNLDGTIPPPPPPNLALGQVFKFSTIEQNGVEASSDLFFGICHSQAFIDPWDKIVVAFDHSTTEGNAGIPGATPPSTSLPGLGLDTEIDWPAGVPLAITTNQNDLWNSGVKVSGGVPSVESNCIPYCRWSNADGQNQDLFPTGVDDSGFPESATVKIGEDVDHFTGRLVGKFSSPFDIGVTKNVPNPEGGLLTLFYQDSNNLDNQDEMGVRVAENSIQCEAVIAGVPTFVGTQGDQHGIAPVEVSYNPAPLNVTNKSSKATFPTVIYGTAALMFGPDGSPLLGPGSSLTLIGQPVALDNFQVSDVNGDSIPDLKLKLNNLDVIKAVTPGGACSNGHISATLVIRTGAGTYFGGADAIELKNCHKL